MFVCINVRSKTSLKGRRYEWKKVTMSWKLKDESTPYNIIVEGTEESKQKLHVRSALYVEKFEIAMADKRKLVRRYKAINKNSDKWKKVGNSESTKQKRY